MGQTTSVERLATEQALTTMIEQYNIINEEVKRHAEIFETIKNDSTMLGAIKETYKIVSGMEEARLQVEKDNALLIETIREYLKGVEIVESAK